MDRICFGSVLEGKQQLFIFKNPKDVKETNLPEDQNPLEVDWEFAIKELEVTI